MIFKLASRTVISVSGEDASSFLQGLLSNDLNRVDSKSYLYALMLTPQGRFMFDFFITKHDSAFLLDTSIATKNELMAKLKIYKLRSKVEIVDLSSEYAVYASLEAHDGFYSDPRNPKLGFRRIAPLAPMEPLSDEAPYHLARIVAKIPDADLDLTFGKSLPIDFAMENLNALDFKKGCYIGQEVTAISHHRGSRRKSLYNAMLLEGNAPPKNTEIYLNETKLGIVLGFVDKQGLLLLNTEEVNKIMDQPIIIKISDSLLSVAKDA